MYAQIMMKHGHYFNLYHTDPELDYVRLKLGHWIQSQKIIVTTLETTLITEYR